jgi:hypothetical protein
LEWGIGDNIVAEAVFARQKIQGFIKVSISSVNKINLTDEAYGFVVTSVKKR